jgi:carboxymethylenebutenolidase
VAPADEAARLRRKFMAIKTEWIRYGDQIGYLALPDRAAPPLPGVVVIQEIYGVNDHIRDVTRRIAAAGYAALAPDLFAVKGERPALLTETRIDEAMAWGSRVPSAARFDPVKREEELAKLPEAERARIRETMGLVFSSGTPDRMAAMMPALRSAVRHLRTERPETRGQRVGCVGFCMGGGLSALLACEEPEMSGAAIFYGMAPPAQKIPNIPCPVIAFYGAKDQRVNDGIPDFQEAMREVGKSFEYHVYEGAGHAFFNDDSPGYNVAASRDSFTRLLAFFSRNLTG